MESLNKQVIDSSDEEAGKLEDLLPEIYNGNLVVDNNTVVTPETVKADDKIKLRTLREQLGLASKDSLQTALGQMEETKLSTTLEEGKYQEQTLKEKVYFGLRNFLGKFIVKSERRQENKHVEIDGDGNYSDDDLYGQGFDVSRRLRIDKEKKEKEENQTAAYREKRSKLFRTNSFLNNPTPLDGNITSAGIDNFLKEINNLTLDQGIQFNVNRYAELLKKKLGKHYEVNFQNFSQDLIKYLTENNERMNMEELRKKLDQLETVIKLGKIKHCLPLSDEEAMKYYKEHARTIPVEQVEKEQGVVIVHGVPYKSTRGFLSNKDLQWQGFGGMDYEQFLKSTLEGDRMISASAIDERRSTKSNFFSGVGMVLKSGKIYDATGDDVVSQNISNSRVANVNIGNARDSRLEARVVESTTPLQRWNEYIIGSPTMKGIFFIKDRLEDLRNQELAVISKISRERTETPEETIRNLARIAEEYGVPLYEFKEGEGFVKIEDVQKYLSKKVSPKHY